jgi:hypothetical protein
MAPYLIEAENVDIVRHRICDGIFEFTLPVMPESDAMFFFLVAGR